MCDEAGNDVWPGSRDETLAWRVLSRRAARGFSQAHPRARPGVSVGVNRKPLYPYYPQPKFRQEILDLIYARKLLPVVGLEGDANTPVSDAAPIRGAAGMTITYTICPPGQGPSLHAHDRTFESRAVCRGRLEVRWGDTGEHSVVLEEFDTISVPPKVCRAFRNALGRGCNAPDRSRRSREDRA